MWKLRKFPIPHGPMSAVCVELPWRAGPALLAVSLASPRFRNFKKPLCLAITVAVVCFVPVLKVRNFAWFTVS